jgi:hypothetical protein
VRFPVLYPSYYTIGRVCGWPDGGDVADRNRESRAA